MEHLRPQGSQLQHLIVSDLIQLPCVLHDSGVRRVHPVHIRVYLAQIRPKGGSQRNCGRIGSASAKGGDVVIAVDSLESRDNHDFLLIQLCLDPLRIHLLDSGIPGHGIGNHSRLPSRQGNNRVSQRLDCHGAEGHRHLLSGGQQHIHLPVGSKGIDLICLLNQLVGGIPLGRQHRHYLVSGLICIRDDFSHMAQPGGVSHRGSSEFLYN